MTKLKRGGAVTAQDVANLAGVSRSAVSRTFTQNGSIAESTRQKVLSAAQELGYQVNFLAQGLNRRKSQLIGVVVSHLSDPFRSCLLEALLTEIQAQGYQALVTEVRQGDKLDETMRRFTQFRVSGVVVTSGQPPEALVQECIHFAIPVVVINREVGLPKVDVVRSDNESGAELAAQQLLQAGCHYIGWLNYKHSTWSGIHRQESFRKALTVRAETGFCQMHSIEVAQNGYEGGREAAHAVVSSGKKLDGIFCATALMACGFLDGLRENGLNAPEDIHVIGFDNTPITEQYSYRLTTIDHDALETARRAIWCLETRAINQELDSRVEKIGARMIYRSTSPKFEPMTKDIL